MREHTVFELMPNHFRLPLAIIGLLLFSSFLIKPVDYSPEELAEATAQREKKAADEKLAKQIDHAERECLAGIQDRLNDPSSFKFHDFRRVFLDKESYIVKIEYSAKNAFGGRVRDIATCKARFS